MANSSFIQGLKPIRNIHSGNYAAQLTKVFIPAGEANDIAVGDPVVFDGASNPAQPIPQHVFGEMEGEYATVAKAAMGAGNPIGGVVAALEPLPVVGYEQAQYRVGGVPQFALIITDPDVEYEIQAQTGVAMTGANVMQNVDLIDGGVETVYGRSGVEADLATLGTAANQQLQILGIQNREADNELGDMVKLRVRINNHQFKAGLAGV